MKLWNRGAKNRRRPARHRKGGPVETPAGWGKKTHRCGRCRTTIPWAGYTVKGWSIRVCATCKTRGRRY